MIFDAKSHLDNAKWAVQNYPFPHLIVPNIFKNDVYSKICEGFRQHKAGSLGQTKRPNYDAEIKSISQDSASQLFPLFDRSLLSLIGKAFRVDPTFEIDGAIHCHPSGSRAGWVHNDYNPGWFATEAKDGLVFSQAGGCNYKKDYSGNESGFVSRMRYITLIYFLSNDEWAPEDGGSTGLYCANSQPVNQPTALCAPLNNTLLAFKCSPYSYHSYMGAKRPRNSITLWLHRPILEARREWPHHEPVYWR